MRKINYFDIHPKLVKGSWTIIVKGTPNELPFFHVLDCRVNQLTLKSLKSIQKHLEKTLGYGIEFSRMIDYEDHDTTILLLDNRFNGKNSRYYFTVSDVPQIVCEIDFNWPV